MSVGCKVDGLMSGMCYLKIGQSRKKSHTGTCSHELTVEEIRQLRVPPETIVLGTVLHNGKSGCDGKGP